MPKHDDELFDRLGDSAPGTTSAARAPSRLKSRIFSALNQKQAESGPLLSLQECKSAGGELCVFEHLVQITPGGAAMHQANYCRVCHARVLAEKIENAPIWWPGCPYVGFQNR